MCKKNCIDIKLYNGWLYAAIVSENSLDLNLPIIDLSIKCNQYEHKEIAITQYYYETMLLLLPLVGKRVIYNSKATLFEASFIEKQY